MSQSSTWAVITGDIVGSRQLDSAVFEAVMSGLADMAARLAAALSESRVIYGRHRGDGWQLALSEPALAVRAGLLMRAAVRACAGEAETRLAIGLGHAHLAEDCDEDLAAAGGPAFERSGEALEALESHRLWGYASAPKVYTNARFVDALVCLLDERSQAWSARQGEIAGALLGIKPPSMAVLADELLLTRQTVQEHFTRAGGYAMRDALAAVEASLSH